MSELLVTLNPIFIVIIFLALLGVLLTIYIHTKKSTQQPMVCPLNGHCEEVIKSSFSKFLGIPVELLGMAYYASTAIMYGIFLIIPSTATTPLAISFFLICCGAFLFSAYLIFVQIFFLKQHCTWCMGSAGISTIIFLLSLYNTGDTAILLLAQYPDIFRSLYSIGLAIGLGGATISLLFLGKFLRDIRISPWEADSLHTISQITWLALATVILSGFILFILPSGNMEERHFSMTQTGILIALASLSTFLDLIILPRLLAISSGKANDHTKKELLLLRKISISVSAMVLLTWLTIFLLGTTSVDSRTALTAYSTAIFGTFIMSMLFTRRLPIEETT